MEAHIQKWGNSLGLRIPMSIAKLLNLHQGSSVILEVKDNQIIIQPPTRKYHLKEMLKEVTSKNRHHEMMDDEEQGNEEWHTERGSKIGFWQREIPRDQMSENDPILPILGHFRSF